MTTLTNPTASAAARTESRTTLTPQQAGHLRHIDNLSRLQVNDWSMMQGRTHGQDGFNAYRYQLAYMIYALALAHRHRLPAAPGLFQPVIRRLIDKLLLPETWMYWHDTSRGGAFFNAHLPLQEEWDPVVRDNIMYSAYVQSAAMLHDYLFGRDDFADEGSLTFRFWTMHWGGDEKRFVYDRDSLNEHIYWQLVQNGYLGVACEPNCIFQICIQPAILGFRMHDLLTGGSRADEAIANYQKAWSEYSRLDENGHYNVLIMQDSKAVIPNAKREASMDAWVGTLMNMWNRDFVREHYPAQLRMHLQTTPAGTLAVRPEESQETNGETMTGEADVSFGWLAAWASEMGDAETLTGLLAHADRFMQPTWRDGGLYYPRNDEATDADGNLTEMGPTTGNALLSYARLNVPDGLWKLFNEPWSADRFAQPAITTVARDVDITRAEVVDGALHARLQRVAGVPGDGSVGVARLVGRGRWSVVADGARIGELDDRALRVDPVQGLEIALDSDHVRVRVGERPVEIAFVPES